MDMHEYEQLFQSIFITQFLFSMKQKYRYSMNTETCFQREKSKFLTERDENRVNQKKLFNGGKPLRFEKIKKEPLNKKVSSSSNSLIPATNSNKLFPYDQETMKDMIKDLKEENGELKQVLRIQQTQINYFQEQEKTLVQNSTGQPSVKKLKAINLQLKRSIQQLKDQNDSLKKNPKYLTLKEMQTTNEVYLREIKLLTAKLKSFKSESHSIEELNRIIQNQYLTSLKNKELSQRLKDKEQEYENSGKVMRKMKNLLTQKNKEIQQLKEMLDQSKNNVLKNKNIEDFVHKSELISKKKQLLYMSEKTQTLELKLTDCENKVETLKQENIENMNRQAQKRKELATAYHELKKKYEILEEAFNQTLRKSSENTFQHIRLDQVLGGDSNECVKKKCPRIVTLDHVKDIIGSVIHRLQRHRIQAGEAMRLLTCEDDDENSCQLDGISIRKLMYRLDKKPIGIEDYQQKELLARYLIEDPTEDSEEISFDSQVNISYVKSILNRIFNSYAIFNEEDIQEQVAIVDEFLKKEGHTIRATLNTMKSGMNGAQFSYSYEDIIAAIRRENQLNQFSDSFILFYTYDLRDQKLTYEEFASKFRKVQDQFIFLTQDPAEEEEGCQSEKKGQCEHFDMII